MSAKSVLEMAGKLYPPDIDRRQVDFSHLMIQVALSGTSKDYVEALRGGNFAPPNEDLKTGLEYWVKGASMMEGGRLRNRTYVAEALLAYADYHRKPVPQLTSDQLWQMALEEASFLVQSVSNMIFSGVAIPKKWESYVTTMEEPLRSHQIYDLLVPFLYLAFAEVVQRVDLRQTLSITSGTSNRPVSINPDEIVESLGDGMSMAEVKKQLTVYYTDRPSTVSALLPTKQFETHEGVVAQVYEGNGRVAVRYPGIEHAMFSGFSRIVEQCDFNDRGLVIDSLDPFIATVREEVLRCYNTVLENAANRRTYRLAAHLDTLLDHLPQRLTALEELKAILGRLHRPLAQIAADADFEKTMAMASRWGRAQIFQSVLGQLASPTKILTEPVDPNMEKAIRSLLHALSKRSAMVHVSEIVSSLLEKLNAFLGMGSKPKENWAITKEELEVFTDLVNLRKKLSSAERESNDFSAWCNEVVALLEKAICFVEEILPRAAGDYEFFVNQWKAEMTGPGQGVWGLIADEYAHRDPASPELVKRGRSLYGLAPHHRRLALNGTDNVAWDLLKKRSLCGLWLGNPFYTEQEAVASSSARDLVLATFPVYPKETVDAPVFFDENVLDSPDYFFGEVVNGRPNKLAFNIYLRNHQTGRPEATITYSLGSIFVRNVSRRSTTLFRQA